MARRLRIEYPGAFHHVMTRGVDGMDIFRDEADRRKYLELLERAVVRSAWLLHDYCLMTNHVHLAIETPDCTLSVGMKWLNQCYAQYFNRRYGRRGPLCQDRFKSVLIDKEEYLLTVSRYIALNPVKAGIAKRPENYEWSSYRARVGYVPPPSWLAVTAVERRFSHDRDLARERYRTFIDEGMDDPRNLAEEFLQKAVIGRAKWLEEIQKLIDEKERCGEIRREEVHIARPAIEDVIEAVAQTFDTTPAEIASSRGTVERRVVAYLAFEEGMIPLRKIAETLGVTSAGGISSQATRCRNELGKDELLRELAEACRNRMRRRPPPFFGRPPERKLVPARRYHRAQSRTAQ